MPRAFVNWSAEHRTTPIRWEAPESEADVLAALDRARREGRRLRPVGSGHSWSRVAFPDEIALSLDHLNRVVAIDAAAQTITVQAGIQLKALSAALDAVGLAMPILGSVSEQTIAGAISTGTHGSSLVHGNLASLVTRMRIAIPGRVRAELIELAEGSEALEAARVSLGALGVITELTLRVVPAFRLIETVETIAPRELAPQLRAIAESSTFVKVWWLPGSGPAHVFRYLSTTLPARERPVVRWIDQRLVNDLVFPAVLSLAARAPALVPPINTLVARSYLDHPRAPVARSDRAFNVAMPPRHYETEYAVGLEDAPWVVGSLVEQMIAASYRIAFPLEVRFVAGDRGWLSPAHGAPVVHVGAYAAEGPDWRGYFRSFEQLAKARRGRPHWGKTCDVGPAYVRDVFPRAGDFVALRSTWDPAGVLRSRFLDERLG